MGLLTRRGLIGVGAGGLLVSGCDRLTNAPAVQRLIGHGQDLSLGAQRLLLSGQPLAKQFTAAEISPVFKVNGSVDPGTEAYHALLADGFATWRLAVSGLVLRPDVFSLTQLKAMPARTQITRHDCVEGWSAIGGWTGVQLAHLLGLVGVAPGARYIVFHCADNLAGSRDASGLYYESIDLVDAFHPQTLLAYAMNGAPLSVGHGAPLRLRVERQLGYKQAKFVMRIEAVSSLAGIGRGKGGFWEDRGYEWYAGI
ncbi:MAG TPA: molybdopterin-binding protein [Caulobacteraceae bacterium]|jgi:DMSO/TMAO reductase YedYZ molybdopterin-dependent catalytic subunit|nr:molybdopterin-binding protein [Caulobacteraceae bacterium]